MSSPISWQRTMNKFFCTIGRDLADKIQPVANPLLSGEYEVNKDKAKFHFKTTGPPTTGGPGGPLHFFAKMEFQNLFI